MPTLTSMKAIVLRGKLKGQVVEIGQWCNDWFTVNTGDPMVDRQPLSPTNLAFTAKDMQFIKHSKIESGMLFRWYHEEYSPDLKLWVFKKNDR